MRISDQNIRGRTIVASDGQQIGEVDSLVLESEGWRVESLHIKLRKDVADKLGATRGVFHAGGLEIPVHMVQSVGDSVVLAVPLNELRKVLPSDGEHLAARK
jgi:sporulation protein YlmC with PRC-barrel domain